MVCDQHRLNVLHAEGGRGEKVPRARLPLRARPDSRDGRPPHVVRDAVAGVRLGSQICGTKLGCRYWLWIWRWCRDTTRGTFYNRICWKFPKVWWCAGHHQILGNSQHLEASPGPVSEARPTGQLRLQTVRSSIGLGVLEASGSWPQPIVAHKAPCTAS